MRTRSFSSKTSSACAISRSSAQAAIATASGLWTGSGVDSRDMKKCRIPWIPMGRSLWHGLRNLFPADGVLGYEERTMNRRDFETLLLTLESTPALLARAAATLAPEQHRCRPSAGGFSFVENVWHLA